MDLIINDQIAIEIKSTKTVTQKMKHGLELIADEGSWLMRLLVTQDPIEKIDDNGLQMLHFSKFLELLWGGGLDQAAADSKT